MGGGSGTYTFSANNLPLAFDCNFAGSFGTDVSPTIDGSYAGFNRVHFELVKGSKTYRSNYVEFLSYNTATQHLEFGGSLPTGEYTGRAYLRNIQLNSTCVDYILVKIDWWVGNVYITQFSNPQKRMMIEYDCQSSDIPDVSSYDVFCSPNTGEYINVAFNVANTTYTLDSSQISLPAVSVVYEPPDYTVFRQYIVDHKDNDSSMYLCGIKQFVDQDEFPLSMFGATQRTSDFHPSYITGSLIAVKACLDWSAGQYHIDYNDIITATVVHELGLQRAISYEGTECTSPFCIMFGSPIYPDRCTYLNPHFCNHCLDLLRNVQ